jgi:hypothetical protein
MEILRSHHRNLLVMDVRGPFYGSTHLSIFPGLIGILYPGPSCALLSKELSNILLGQILIPRALRSQLATVETRV